MVTTLWARLALSDLFLHGIGGAKYDQVTDRLMETFFGLDPPGIMVLSATLCLPVPRLAANGGELHAIRRDLRNLDYHPEKYLREITASQDVSAATACGPEQRWIDAARERRQRVSALEGDFADQQRVAAVGGGAQQLRDQQTQMQRAMRREKVLASREYGFCLFGESYLQDFFAALLPKRA